MTVLDGGLAWFDTVDLDGLAGAADLQRRFDAKFLVSLGDVDRLLVELTSRMRVLEVGGRRASRYRTTYFDTPDLASYHAHVQGRRRRYKVRTRTYGDAETMLELKIKSTRGLTVKHRWPHPASDPDTLGDEARVLVGGAVHDMYGWPLPDPLVPSVRTEFHRVTLADLAVGERITIDVGLRVAVGDVERPLDPEVAVVECKTSHLHGPILVTMGRLGHHPMAISKYGLGVTLLHPDRRGNVWLPALRRLQPAANVASC